MTHVPIAPPLLPELQDHVPDYLADRYSWFAAHLQGTRLQRSMGWWLRCQNDMAVATVGLDKQIVAVMKATSPLRLGTDAVERYSRTAMYEQIAWAEVLTCTIEADEQGVPEYGTASAAPCMPPAPPTGGPGCECPVHQLLRASGITPPAQP